jgi:hypothetical protein
MPRFRMPSPAMCVALVGLSVALGGTTWAAVSLPARSVGTAQLKADAVTGGKVKNHSLTGADIKSSSLGRVPSANRANLANTATHADSAMHADAATHATSADVAGAAYSTHFETARPVPTTPTTMASLQLPAGSYLLAAKGQIDTQVSTDIVECDLVAGADKDVAFVQGGTSHESAILTNSLVHVFATAGTVNLTCATFLTTSGAISQVRVTAVTVGTIVDTPAP